MEAALLSQAKDEYSRYGSTAHKQVYIYGSARHRSDRVQPRLRHELGHRRLVADAVPATIGPRAAQALRSGWPTKLKTTFASHYTPRDLAAGDAAAAT